MKRLVLKNWLDKILKVLVMLSLMLIVCTIDNEWTSEYLIFLAINIITFVVSAKILIKYSKDI